MSGAEMPDITDPNTVAVSMAAVGVLVGGMFFVGKMWKPFRRFVSLVDILLGRLPRYEGDPEARPGIIQKFDETDKTLKCMSSTLDDIDSKLNALGPKVDHLDERVSRVEEKTSSTDHIVRRKARLAMWTKKFWKDAGERAVKTFAQITAAELTVIVSTSYDLDLQRVALFTVTAVAYSVVTSISSKKVGDNESAALAKRETE